MWIEMRGGLEMMSWGLALYKVTAPEEYFNDTGPISCDCL